MTATIPPATDHRECRLYRFWVRQPETGQRVLGYIGETVQQPFDRLMQHIARQPWADTILGWDVDERVFHGKDEVVAAEKAAVESEKPFYNDEWNHGNPDRISLEEAKLQRWARDDARGMPRWRPGRRDTMYRNGWELPAPERQQPRPYGVVKTVPTKQARRWRPWQKRLAYWACVWLFLDVDLFTAVMHWHVGHVGWKQAGGDAAMLTTVLVGVAAIWWHAGHPLPRRKRRRRSGRRR